MDVGVGVGVGAASLNSAFTFMSEFSLTVAGLPELPML